MSVEDGLNFYVGEEINLMPQNSYCIFNWIVGISRGVSLTTCLVLDTLLCGPLQTQPYLLSQFSCEIFVWGQFSDAITEAMGRYSI